MPANDLCVYAVRASPGQGVGMFVNNPAVNVDRSPVRSDDDGGPPAGRGATAPL